MLELNKIKVLNLYAGLGGNRKLWENVEVTAIEINPEIGEIYKNFFPKDNVIITDAHQYLLEHFKEFDFIWSSPPCQSHSKIRMIASKSGSYNAIFPDVWLWQEIIFLKHFSKIFFVVENVKPYYKPFLEPTVELDRHLFWSNFAITKKEFDKPEAKHNKVTSKTSRFEINLLNIPLKHRKDQIIRNCINPEIGLHIFNCAFGIANKRLANTYYQEELLK